MRIIAIRHLPTSLNIDGVLQGRSDLNIDSSMINKAEIYNNLKFLNQISIDKVYSSPLKRARETANQYGYFQHDVDERLVEFDFGLYENCSKHKMLQEVGNVWMNKFSEVQMGESSDILRSRLLEFISLNSNLENVLIFSHGVVIRSLIAMSGLIHFNKTNQLEVKNNSIHLITIS